MTGFFKRLLRRTEAIAEQPLYFKDGEAAFEYSCRFLTSELRGGNILPALVLDATVALGAELPVVRMKDGTQMLALRVSSRDGGFLVLASTLSATGPSLKPGDLVAWSAGKPITRETVELNRTGFRGGLLA